MSQSSDFLASFTDTSTQAATYEGFLSDTRIDVAALLYNQGNVISYDLSFSDDPLSLFALAMPSDSQLGGSIQPPANQMPSFASASYPSLNTIAHPMRGLGDLDHHLPVISTVYSAHLNDLAVSVPGHFLAESAKGKAPLTSDETPKRKRSPVNEEGPRCQWKGCRNRRSFNRKEDLLRHVRTMHIFQGLHVCPVKGCYKRCNREDNLREHINRCHGKTANVEDDSE